MEPKLEPKLKKLRSRQRKSLEHAKKYIEEQTTKHVLMKSQILVQQNQQKATLYAQALSYMSRIYVGQISYDITEEEVQEMFAEFGPIKGISINYDASTARHKGYAFVHYDYPEPAAIARDHFHGKFVRGKTLRVTSAGHQNQVVQAQKTLDDFAENSENKFRVIYVGSIHPDVAEEDLRSVFEPFGEITNCKVRKQATGNRAYAFVEFASPAAVDEAIQGMNDFKLGGMPIKVCRAIAVPDLLTMPPAASVQVTGASKCAESLPKELLPPPGANHAARTR